MSTQEQPAVGTVGWWDLTVPDADRVRDFYREVVGWNAEPVDMGDYHDYNMVAPGTGQPVAGVCHARGNNAGLPPQWLMYITVDDVDTSARRCAELGGEIIAGPNTAGGGSFCVIRDPAGAVCALYGPAA